MNIGNITSDNFNLDSNGKDIQIEVYEQLIEQLQQKNKVIDKVYELIKQHIRKDGFLELNEWQTRDLLDILKEVK